MGNGEWRILRPLSGADCQLGPKQWSCQLHWIALIPDFNGIIEMCLWKRISREVWGLGAWLDEFVSWSWAKVFYGYKHFIYSLASEDDTLNVQNFWPIYSETSRIPLQGVSTSNLSRPGDVVPSYSSDSNGFRHSEASRVQVQGFMWMNYLVWPGGTDMTESPLRHRKV